MMETPTLFEPGHEYLPSKRFAFHSRVWMRLGLPRRSSAKPGAEAKGTMRDDCISEGESKVFELRKDAGIIEVGGDPCAGS